jgi:hypothetical protein
MSRTISPLLIVGQQGNADPGQGHVADHLAVVDRQIAVHRERPGPRPAEQRPAPALARHAVDEAVVMAQVLDGLGFAVAREVARRRRQQQRGPAETAGDQGRVRKCGDA